MLSSASNCVMVSQKKQKETIPILLMIDCADFLQRLGKDANTSSDTAVVSIACELL